MPRSPGRTVSGSGTRRERITARDRPERPDRRGRGEEHQPRNRSGSAGRQVRRWNPPNEEPTKVARSRPMPRGPRQPVRGSPRAVDRPALGRTADVAHDVDGVEAWSAPRSAAWRYHCVADSEAAWISTTGEPSGHPEATTWVGPNGSPLAILDGIRHRHRGTAYADSYADRASGPPSGRPPASEEAPGRPSGPSSSARLRTWSSRRIIGKSANSISEMEPSAANGWSRS